LLRTAEASNILMHEVVHALTVDMIDHPKTIEEQELATATNKLYSTFSKEITEDEYALFDSVTGAYILHDKKEFVAEFVTN